MNRESNNFAKRIGETNLQNLDALAYELATNYCTASFGQDEKRTVKVEDIFEKSGIVMQGLNNKTDPNVTAIRQHRNILVIGAGATYDSYKCIPLGQQVINSFNEKYLEKIRDFPAIQEKYDNYVKDLNTLGGELDFENYLSFFAELLTPEELRKKLSELFNFRYGPSLFYEIVAHLFKHSFIDVIVNFNFDELLDRVIEEEVGKENYFHIISDGDCISVDDISVDGRIKTPVYIKPHGTISHKTSLRFTKRQYLDIPKKISDLLKELISGKRGEVNTIKKVPDITQVNLIPVGFNMASVEFNEILDRCLPKHSKIFHFTFSREDSRDPSFVKKLYPNFYAKALKEWRLTRNIDSAEELKNFDVRNFDHFVYKRIAVQDMIETGKEDENRLLNSNTLTTPFSELFSYLWRKVYFDFKKDLRPRSIGSHEVVSYLFYDNEYSKNTDTDFRDKLNDQYENSIEYFLDRTIVEIAIAINRNNGIIEIAQLLGDRVGYYYTLYRKRYIEETKTSTNIYSIYDLVSEFIDEEERGETYFTTNILKLKIKSIEKIDAEDYIIKLRRWELAQSVNLEKDVAKAKNTNNQEIIEDIRNKLRQIIKKSYGGRVEVPFSVLFYLFSSRIISENFINNFKKNYKKTVYNYNDYGEKFDIESTIGINHSLLRKLNFGDENSQILFPTMFDELIRILIKSTAGHFYTIKPKYNDTKNFLTRSFSKSAIMHTNLALEYKFREMLIHGDWDAVLIIAENGNLIKFLKESSDKDLKEKIREGSKKIVMINSIEAIGQLYLNEDFETLIADPKKLSERRTKDYNSMLGITDAPSTKSKVCTYCLPSHLHNHHMMVFIKIKNIKEKKDDRFQSPYYDPKDGRRRYEMIGALYMYRRGFSNTINPLFVGADIYDQGDKFVKIQKDFRKLLSMFLINISRALQFNSACNPLKLNKDTINNYIYWNTEKEEEALSHFLKKL